MPASRGAGPRRLLLARAAPGQLRTDAARGHLRERAAALPFGRDIGALTTNSNFEDGIA